jgi:hypothetical protein
MIYNPKIIILYKEDDELNNLIVNRLFQLENIITIKIKVTNKSDYYNLHGTRVEGLYISNKLKSFISDNEILDILEPMLNISIFNSIISWF